MEFAIVRARNYLESQLNHTLDDPYALALMSYALQVSGSSMASEALAALNVHATVEGKVLYLRFNVRKFPVLIHWGTCA